MRGEYDVPAGIPGDDLGEHLLVALVGGVADAHAEFRLEVGNGLGGYVCRPVVDVEARARIARTAGESRHPQEKIAAVHVSRTLSEIRIRIPKTRVMSAEMALMTGLEPRRAMA